MVCARAAACASTVGREALVNYRVEKGYIVIERVTSRYTLRHGNDVICVFNEKPLLRNNSGIKK